MKRNAVETVMGAVVIVVAAVFLFFAYSTTRIHTASGYDLTARFERIEGIRDGSDVKISGIKVGTVTDLSLDPKTFLAIVRMNIDPQVKLPKDSVATIASNGLLGDKFLALEPGGEDAIIAPGGEIQHTQAPMSLETLIGQYIFSQGGSQQKGGGNAQQPAPPKQPE